MELSPEQQVALDQWLMQHGGRTRAGLFKDERGWYVLMATPFAPNGRERVYALRTDKPGLV